MALYWLADEFELYCDMDVDRKFAEAVKYVSVMDIKTNAVHNRDDVKDTDAGDITVG